MNTDRFQKSSLGPTTLQIDGVTVECNQDVIDTHHPGRDPLVFSYPHPELNGSGELLSWPTEHWPDVDDNNYSIDWSKPLDPQIRKLLGLAEEDTTTRKDK